MTTTAESTGLLASPPEVWDRLWNHAPSEGRDDALLARESRTSRWLMIRERLIATYGSLRGLRTIELGSGRGDLSALLAQEGAEVTLLDTSERALAQARRRFDRRGWAAQYEKGDLFSPDANLRQSFDVSLSSGVIEHFEGDDRTRAIRAHRDVLDRGGTCIISVPNAWCPTYRLWKLHLELRGWWPYGMERPYSRRELVYRAEQAGLTVVEIFGCGFWQSVGDHLFRRMVKGGPDWADRPSRLDHRFGLSIVMLGSNTQ